MMHEYKEVDDDSPKLKQAARHCWTLGPLLFHDFDADFPVTNKARPAPVLLECFEMVTNFVCTYETEERIAEFLKRSVPDIFEANGTEDDAASGEDAKSKIHVMIQSLEVT
jgi:hypothetical protein